MLIRRQPAFAKGLQGWVFAGPLNPGALLLFLLVGGVTSGVGGGAMAAALGSALLLVSAPAAIGVAIVLFLLRKRSELRLTRLIWTTVGVAALVAVATGFLFGAVTSLSAFSGRVEPVMVLSQATWVALWVGVFGQIFAIPAGFIAAGMLRWISFQKGSSTNVADVF